LVAKQLSKRPTDEDCIDYQSENVDRIGQDLPGSASLEGRSMNNEDTDFWTIHPCDSYCKPTDEIE
jgi:hypothetical protein